MTDTASTLADRLEGIALAGQEMSLIVGPAEALELSRMLRGELSNEHERRWLSLNMQAADFWAWRRHRDEAFDQILWAILWLSVSVTVFGALKAVLP